MSKQTTDTQKTAQKPTTAQKVAKAPTKSATKRKATTKAPTAQKAAPSPTEAPKVAEPTTTHPDVASCVRMTEGAIKLAELAAKRGGVWDAVSKPLTSAIERLEYTVKIACDPTSPRPNMSASDLNIVSDQRNRLVNQRHDYCMKFVAQVTGS